MTTPTLAAQRRARYAASHDIYGNDESAQAEINQMMDESMERTRQTVQAFRDQLRAQPGEPWHRPMGVDEQFRPGTKLIYDYGRLDVPEAVKIVHRLDTSL
jgi:hypothetical protein